MLAVYKRTVRCSTIEKEADVCYTPYCPNVTLWNTTLIYTVYFHCFSQNPLLVNVRMFLIIHFYCILWKIRKLGFCWLLNALAFGVIQFHYLPIQWAYKHYPKYWILYCMEFLKFTFGCRLKSCIKFSIVVYVYAKKTFFKSMPIKHPTLLFM